MTDERKRRSWGEMVGEGAVDAMEQFQARAYKPAMKALGPGGKLVLKSAIKGPGWVYAGAKLLTEEDILRAAAGSAAGGFAGGALGAAAGGVAAPIGVVLGSSFGDDLATELYDDWREANARRAHETRRINDRRNAEQRRDSR